MLWGSWELIYDRIPTRDFVRQGRVSGFPGAVTKMSEGLSQSLWKWERKAEAEQADEGGEINPDWLWEVCF